MTQKNEMSARALTKEELENVNGGKKVYDFKNAGSIPKRRRHINF